MAHAEIGCKLFLKRLHTSALQIPSAAHYSCHLIRQQRLEAGIYPLQVQELYRCIFRLFKGLHLLDDRTVYFQFIRIIAYRTSTETFFLENQTFVQVHSPSLC